MNFSALSIAQRISSGACEEFIYSVDFHLSCKRPLILTHGVISE